MAKSPHTPEFRAMVSQEYLDGLGSYDFLANKYQIGSQTLKQWVAKYRLYGLLAFQDKKGTLPIHPILKQRALKLFCLEQEALMTLLQNIIFQVGRFYETGFQCICQGFVNRELKDYNPIREVHMAEARRKTTIDERMKIVKYCTGHNRNYKDTASLKSFSSETTAENKLRREFYADAPNQKWATDVTEFKVPGEKKKLYLSATLDLYDPYPISYVISRRNDNRLVFKTFHSDRGFQYTSKVFQRKLKEQKMKQSM